MTVFTVTNAKILRKGALVGVFTLQTPSGLIVHGAMLFEKNGKRWVNFPSKEFTKPDGTKGYLPLLEFADRSIADKFQRQVLPIAEEVLLGTSEPAPKKHASAPAAVLDDSIPW